MEWLKSIVCRERFEVQPMNVANNISQQEIKSNDTRGPRRVRRFRAFGVAFCHITVFESGFCFGFAKTLADAGQLKPQGLGKFFHIYKPSSGCRENIVVYGGAVGLSADEVGALTQMEHTRTRNCLLYTSDAADE